MTAEQFKTATGRDPQEADLDRVNCEQAGEPGHWGCGWCYRCNRPVYECGHRRESKREREKRQNEILGAIGKIGVILESRGYSFQDDD